MSGTGKGGRVTKEDVIHFMQGKQSAPQKQEQPTKQAQQAAPKGQPSPRAFKIAPLVGITEKDQ